MAEYFAEGLLERLLGIEGSVDGLVAQLLQKYTFYIVPNMCPDGSVHGYLRTNAGVTISIVSGHHPSSTTHPLWNGRRKCTMSCTKWTKQVSMPF
jgi:murein tripeptide amidase MpaA